MRHGRKLLKLSRKSKPRRHLLKNLVLSLVEHERIVTTSAKARAMRGLADKLITMAKKPGLSLSDRKQLLARILPKQQAIDKVINELLPRFEYKKGNYTVTRHQGYRKGDGAKLSIVEYHGNNYYLYEKENKKESIENKFPEFTVKVLREEASFFKEAIEKVEAGDDGNKKKFLMKQLERVQRELSFLDKSEIHI
jgi:large subunit ribosomal protein L17